MSVGDVAAAHTSAQSTSALTERLQFSWHNRVRSTLAEFDLLHELDEVLGEVGLGSSDAGGVVQFYGSDPIVPSALRLGSAGAIGLLAKSVAAAAIHRWRGGEAQDISLDIRNTPHRLCPSYDQKWELLSGYPIVSSAEVVGAREFYQCADGRWVIPQNRYPGLRARAEELLGVPFHRDRLSNAISKWNGRDLEEAAAELGVVMPMVRSLPEMLAEDQYRCVLARMPLIELVRVCDSDPIALPPVSEYPFSGFRALGMGHVIAGAGFGRSLALHGADVLNLWRPGELEHENAYFSANVGVRSALLDPRHDRDALYSLLRDADIFYHNRHPKFMDSIGLSVDDACAMNPGLIYVAITLHGRRGSWANRPGFDQSAGAVAGIMDLEGTDERPELPPITVVNDYIVPWLAQAGVVAALRRRAVEGGSYMVHISLTRVALWLLSLGIFDKDWAVRTAGSDELHRYMDPETFEADTDVGRYRGVTDQVMMSGTPGAYSPVLVARGSSDRRWKT